MKISIRLDDTGFHSPEIDAFLIQWGLTGIPYQVVMVSDLPEDEIAYRVDMYSDVMSSEAIIACLPSTMHILYQWEKSGRAFVGWTPSAYFAQIHESFRKHGHKPKPENDK